MKWEATSLKKPLIVMIKRRCVTRNDDENDDDNDGDGDDDGDDGGGGIDEKDGDGVAVT